MLSAAISATNGKRSLKLPKVSDDLKWLLDRAEELADARNNAVHAPCSFSIGANGGTLIGAAFFTGNPRAKKLKGKDLFVEFEWCAVAARVLSLYVGQLETAIAFPDRYEWPNRPTIPSRTDVSGVSRA
jgi:hypothetical protein